MVILKTANEKIIYMVADMLLTLGPSSPGGPGGPVEPCSPWREKITGKGITIKWGSGRVKGEFTACGKYTCLVSATYRGKKIS